VQEQDVVRIGIADVPMQRVVQISASHARILQKKRINCFHLYILSTVRTADVEILYVYMSSMKINNTACYV